MGGGPEVEEEVEENLREKKTLRSI